jgi:Co/Zn/Cd efflux system component
VSCRDITGAPNALPDSFLNYEHIHVPHSHSIALLSNTFCTNHPHIALLLLLMFLLLLLYILYHVCVYTAFNSAVLVADAGHSLSDLFSDFITLWAVQIARLPADDDHPYG